MNEETQENDFVDLIVQQIASRPARNVVVTDPKVFSYARYSTPSQRETSIDRQDENIEKYAKSIGVTVDEHFVDRGISGAEISRHGLDALIAACQRHPGSIVIVENIDRMTRRMDVYFTVQLALGACQTTIHESCSGPLNDLMGPIRAFIAAEDRTRSIGRMKDGKRRLVRAGGKLGPAPFGYRREPHGRFVVDPDQAEIVRSLFERRARGLTIQALTRDLNARGIPTPRNASYWYASTVRSILTNPIYVGVSVTKFKEDVS